MLMKVELVELLFDSVGLNKCEVKDMVEVFFEVICDVFENGESVKLLGFGNFQLCDKLQCLGCNLKMGEVILIVVCWVVIFYVSQKLKVLVENGVE